MMQSYIYDACYTTQLDYDIDFNADNKKLIMELNHKYGLKVFQKIEILKNKGWGDNFAYYFKSDIRDWVDGVKKGEYTEIDAFLLTLDDGLPYALAWATNGKVHGMTYYFYNPRFYKEKSQNTIDHHTLRSVKLPQLIKNIKLQKAIPSKGDVITTNYVREVSDMVGNVDRVLSDKNYHNIKNEDIHDMLKVLLGQSTMNSIDDKLKTTMTETLEKMNDVDVRANNLKASLTEVLGKEFHMLLTYGTEGYVVGRAKFNYVEKGRVDDDKPIIYTQELKRVVSLDEYDEIDSIRHILTMQKLKLEEKDERDREQYVVKDYFYNRDEYFDDILVINKSKDRWGGKLNYFDHCAIIIPKG
jgi:hypothetical protein